MKSLEKDRNRRYDSPAALAEELRRHLANEPVTAGSPTRRYRIGKFLRRNRAMVTAAAAIVVALVAGVIGTSWGMIRAKQALAELSLEKNKTTDALTAALAARNQTREALATLTDDVVENMLARQPKVSESDKAFLKKVISQYEKIQLIGDETEEDRFVRASGTYRVARIRQNLGESQPAEAEYRSALDQFLKLAADYPTKPDYRSGAVRTRTNLGLLLSRLNRPESEQILIAAREMASALVAENPESVRYLAQLCDVQINLAIQYYMSGRVPQALTEWVPARDSYLTLVAKVPNEPKHRATLGQVRMNIGYAIANSDHARFEDAKVEMIAARELLSALVNDYPTNPQYRALLP
ncbi:MAG: hypothetical protein ACJ8C4_01740 [Gemmataceae bacterium]